MNRQERRAASKRSAVESAMSIARDVTEGRLDADKLDERAVIECRRLFGTVIGPEDPLWELHVDVARQVLSLDGMSTNELAEWLAVSRSRVVSGDEPAVDVGLESDADETDPAPAHEPS